MLAPSPVIKSTAKTALFPRFLQSVAVCSVLIFTFYIIELMGSIASIFSGLVGYFATIIILLVTVFAPLFLGVLNFFKRLLWNQDDSVLIIFKFFSSLAIYKRALHFIVLFCIKLVSAAAVLFFPCLIVWLLSSEKLYALLGLSLPVCASNLWALNSFLSFLALLALCFVMLKYYLSAFIFVGNEGINVAEAINMSVIISKRTGGDFFGLLLSFAPWILLSFFLVPLVFTVPYFLASYAVHCRYAIAAYNRDVERFNAEFAPSFSTDEI